MTGNHQGQVIVDSLVQAEAFGQPVAGREIRPGLVLAWLRRVNGFDAGAHPGKTLALPIARRDSRYRLQSPAAFRTSFT